jgi:hypothetical protein
MPMLFLERRKPNIAYPLGLTNYSQRQNKNMPNLNAKSKRVTFGNDITIIEFPMVIGDNPGVSSGAPVQIGWVPQSTITMNLDLHEHFREGNRSHKKKLILKVHQRVDILLRAGYPLEAIVAAAIKTDLIRNSRVENLVDKKEGWERFSIVLLEKTGRIPKGLVNGVLGATNGVFGATNGIITTTGDILVSTSKSVKNIVVARHIIRQRSVPAKTA